MFAGKLDYPKYNFFNKYVIKFIMWVTDGPTQTDVVVEFTNWNDVKKFVNEIHQLQI